MIDVFVSVVDDSPYDAVITQVDNVMMFVFPFRVTKDVRADIISMFDDSERSEPSKGQHVVVIPYGEAAHFAAREIEASDRETSQLWHPSSQEPLPADERRILFAGTTTTGKNNLSSSRGGKTPIITESK